VIARRWLNQWSGQLTDELRNLDLSAYTFDEFVKFSFDRRIVSDKEIFDHFHIDLAGQRFEEAEPSRPEVLVSYMTELFSKFGEIAHRYPLTQIDQGIWAIIGPCFNLAGLLFAPSIQLPMRLECIRSMFSVYSGPIAKLEADSNLTGLFMWWDLVLDEFWTPPRSFVAGTYKGDASKLDTESRVLLDAMFETLKRILLLPDRETQRCALHGLGHLHHPGVRDTVQRYIDANNSELPLGWIEKCRDGVVQ
jgi:hypothetical protein